MTENKTRFLPLLIITFCITAVLGYFTGNTGINKPTADTSSVMEELQALNRESVMHMSPEGTIHVIGHKSPDSDTVCSAIAYARLLNMLGYDAVPNITEKVNNETAYILEQAGVEMPEILESAAGETVFMVDHSEYIQAANDMEDAHVIGVLDHHGVGTLNTGHQVVYQARPIGATATIVWLDYLNYGLEIDQQTAYILLGAILSDTSNLTVTSTTDADRKAVPALAEIAGVSDTEALFKILHEKSFSYEGMTDLEILFSDYKEYEVGTVTFGIGQINSLNEETSKDLSARMKNIAEEACAQKDVDLLFASVGIREDGVKIDYIVPLNDASKQMMEDAFPNYDEYDGTSYIYRTGLGRKTKFVPGLTDYISAHPHES